MTTNINSKTYDLKIVGRKNSLAKTEHPKYSFKKKCTKQCGTSDNEMARFPGRECIQTLGLLTYHANCTCHNFDRPFNIKLSCTV